MSRRVHPPSDYIGAMKTKAAVAFDAEKPLTITEVDLDEPRAGEVRIRIVASGVCHTDAIVRDQWYPTPLPAVLGHEGAGVVDAIGPGVTKVEGYEDIIRTARGKGYRFDKHPDVLIEQF